MPSSTRTRLTDLTTDLTRDAMNQLTGGVMNDMPITEGDCGVINDMPIAEADSGVVNSMPIAEADSGIVRPR